MTDYDMHDLIREHTERIRDRLYALDGAPERYDQRLTQALLAECDG